MSISGLPNGGSPFATLTLVACVACGSETASEEQQRGGAGGTGTGGTEQPGGEAGSETNGAGGGSPGDELPYAREIVSFEPGKGAGFGEDRLPEVVLGPPSGRGERQGSLNVLSLGRKGSIVLGFGELG